MIPFTLAAVAALSAFPWKMRSNSLTTSFGWRGVLVLISIGVMICCRPCWTCRRGNRSFS